MNKSEAIAKYAALDGVEKRLNSNKVTYSNFIDILSKDSYNLQELGLATGSTAKLIKRVFPEKHLINKSCKPCYYLLYKYNSKYCIKCRTVLDLSNFYAHEARWDKLGSYCKSCSDSLTNPTAKERAAKHRAAKLQAVPKWADLDKISDIYRNCPDGHQVDHIIPLQGVDVCGLHVENNLQYLTKFENASKGNKL
jgi:hypothetical protein